MILIAIWQVAALMVNKTGILPSPIINIFAGKYPPTSIITCIPELWIEDLLLKNALYSLYLNGMGYRVEMAKVVSEMIRRVRNGDIQVVLLDDEIEDAKVAEKVKSLDDYIKFLMDIQKVFPFEITPKKSITKFNKL
jgi:hypothetical protein